MCREYVYVLSMYKGCWGYTEDSETDLAQNKLYLAMWLLCNRGRKKGKKAGAGERERERDRDRLRRRGLTNMSEV